MTRQTFQSWLLKLVFLGLSFVVLGAVFCWLIPERMPYGFDHPNRVLTAEVLLSTLDEKRIGGSGSFDRRFAEIRVGAC